MTDQTDPAPAAAAKAKSIRIDGVDYDVDTLSPAARGALGSMQFIDAKMLALQSELAICQTSRMAFIKAIKADISPCSAQ
ncbi:MAG: hypothetical protein ABF254_00770 [Octadecabacter sp.]